MTPDAFIEALEEQLHLAGRPFDRAAVLAFVADAWPRIDEDPDPVMWAREFLDVQVQQTALP